MSGEACRRGERTKYVASAILREPPKNRMHCAEERMSRGACRRDQWTKCEFPRSAKAKAELEDRQ